MFDPEAARRILEMELPEATRQRMGFLIEKAKESTLTPDEKKEALSYEQMGDLLSILKARARDYLKKNPPPP